MYMTPPPPHKTIMKNKWTLCQDKKIRVWGDIQRKSWRCFGLQKERTKLWISKKELVEDMKWLNNSIEQAKYKSIKQRYEYNCQQNDRHKEKYETRQKKKLIKQ